SAMSRVVRATGRLPELEGGSHANGSRHLAVYRNLVGIRGHVSQGCPDRGPESRLRRVEGIRDVQGCYLRELAALRGQGWHAARSGLWLSPTMGDQPTVVV